MGKEFVIDGITKQTVSDMVKCLLTSGEVNLGWKEIGSVLLHDGETVIALGSGTGGQRASDACQDVLAHYRTAVDPTKRVARSLFRLTGPTNLLLREVHNAIDIIESSLRPAGEMVFGVARDNNLRDEVRIVLLATLAS